MPQPCSEPFCARFNVKKLIQKGRYNVFYASSCCVSVGLNGRFNGAHFWLPNAYRITITVVIIFRRRIIENTGNTIDVFLLKSQIYR